MRLGDRVTRAAHATSRGTDRAVRGTPAEREDARFAGRVVDFERRDAAGDAVDLRLPRPHHEVVVVGVVADVAGAVGLLDAADAMLQPGCTRHSPWPGQRLRIAQV